MSTTRKLVAKVQLGVTLIEVIFSIGVILVGLVGIVSILPLAGRRAQDSISISAGSAMCDSVFHELKTRGFLARGLLYNVDTFAAIGRASIPLTPFQSFCIDPMFVANRNPRATNPLPTFSNLYEPRLFPYYDQIHDPTQDPSTGYTETWPVVQPRLLRVGIREEFVVPPATVQGSISVEESLSLVERRDDIPAIRPKDKTLSATMKGVNAVSSGSDFGKQLASGEFSWIATVNPLPGNEFASVAVAIIRNRDRDFELPTTTTAPARPDGNQIGERLAYVTYATGFRGGAGGVIHIVSNQNTVSKVLTGDWLMMSRTTPSGDVHRWYRVSAVDGDAIKQTRAVAEDTTAGSERSGLPGTGTREVWSRKLYLDGPDWSFSFFSGMTPTLPNGYADTSFADNTVVTLVEGVVSVTEKVVSLNDL